MYAHSLIVVAHPGEEILSCARLLIREPELCRVLHLADGPGGSSRDHILVGAKNPSDYGRIRNKEARMAMKRLSIPRDRVSSLGLPERGILTEFDAAIAAVLRLIRDERPLDLYLV
jgi:LmbE family N-acetylglucosaminyl deacetylase